MFEVIDQLKEALAKLHVKIQENNDITVSLKDGKAKVKESMDALQEKHSVIKEKISSLAKREAVCKKVENVLALEQKVATEASLLQKSKDSFESYEKKTRKELSSIEGQLAIRKKKLEDRELALSRARGE